MRVLLLFFILLNAFSCDFSSRKPASETSVFSSSFSPSEVLSIYSTNDQVEGEAFTVKDLQKYAQSKLRSIDSAVPGNQNVIVETISKELPENVALSFDVEVKENGQFIFKIFHSETEDKVANAKAYYFLDSLIDSKKIQTYFDLFEWFYNVRERDPIALNNIAKTWDEAALKVNLIEEDKILFQEYRKGITNSLDSEVKALKKERKILESSRKEGLKILDKASNDDQLRTLVAKGNREEAAVLIESYLPREQMSPFENKFWNEMIEAMRNPAPLDERVLIFRGIEGDMVYPAIENGLELEKSVAIKESKIFTMSSVMTKNQGTWNRRLRSLQTMMDKFIGQHNKTSSSEFTQSFRISTFFKQHSRNPQGSPFLSYTPKISVASAFGKNRAVAYLIDPRSMLANYTSFYKGEFEFLSTLITFPDEMVSVYDSELHGNLGNKQRKTFFLDALRERMIKEYGQEDGLKNYEKVKKNFDFYNEFDNLADLEKGEVKGKDSFLKKFFNKIISFFKKKKPVEEVIEEVAEGQAKGCNYILKTIWSLN